MSGIVLRATGCILIVLASSSSLRAAESDLPSVASINLCTDQLVLSLADDEQILSVSWLSADPEESMLAEKALRFPLNYGSAEELLRYEPDVVVAGSFTNAFTRSLVASVGYSVVEISPAESVEDIAGNLRRVGDAIGQAERAEKLIAAMQARRNGFERARPARPVGAVVIRPGGFTVGARSLANELMTLAGLNNVSVEQGLDRWGSLSIETLMRSAPELMIFTGYRSDQASLANTVFDHPALEHLAERAAAALVPAAEWGCGLPESLDSVATLQRAAAALSGGARESREEAAVSLASARTVKQWTSRPR